MRFLAAATTIAVCLFAAHVGLETGIVAMGKPKSAFAQTGPSKTPGAGAPVRGNDTCEYAHDNECDEPEIGTSLCAVNTDYSDCRHLRQGENDSCRFARDGECDEPNFGTGVCTQGTDRTDCGEIAWMRNQNDSCRTAFNGVCEDGPDGACAPRTDRSDCHGRDRPMRIFDHFFGHDDRVLVNVNEAPWRFTGRLELANEGICTATLVARDVILTAAHCVFAGGRIHSSDRFVSAGGEAAHISAFLVDPGYNDETDGRDWALLRLDRPLGDELGFAGMQNLVARGPRVPTVDLMQAGYGWDTGDNLAGTMRCHVSAVLPDNTFTHDCDITHGHSGSAIFVRDGQGFDVVGVVSSFRSNPTGPFLYIAVSTGAFATRLPDFAAGRTGTRVSGGAGKPPRAGGEDAVER